MNTMARTVRLVCFLQLMLASVIMIRAKKDYAGYKVITVTAETRAQLQVLERMEAEGYDFWIGPRQGSSDILVSGPDFPSVRQQLQEADMEVTVLVAMTGHERENDGNYPQLREAASTITDAPLSARFAPCNISHEYCDYNQIMDFIQQKATDYLDKFVTYQIGTTANGRPIYCVKIASDISSPKQAILVETGTHAREWVTVSLALNLMEKLLTDESMLEDHDWHIIPVHNPDGYVYTWTDDRFWRKNREDLGKTCGKEKGVDLNRNWDAEWTASKQCKSQAYPGPSAFSAAETSAIRDLDIPDLKAFFAIHSYSQLILLPYGYTSNDPENLADLGSIAEKMKSTIYDVDSKSFVISTIYDFFGSIYGSSIDYMYDRGVQYSFAFEMRPASSIPGFELPEDQIEKACQEIIAALQTFAGLPLNKK